MQHIGSDHQADMCQTGCSASHDWFFVRVCPSHSQTNRPGRQRKRRLDLKLDLSSDHCCGSFQKLLSLSRPQLEVSPMNMHPDATACSIASMGAISNSKFRNCMLLHQLSVQTEQSIQSESAEATPSLQSKSASKQRAQSSQSY